VKKDMRCEAAVKKNEKIVLCTALCSLLFAFCSPVEAQQAKKIPKVGVLRQSSAHVLWTQLEAFRQGLRERGYAEGQNINIEYRYAEGEIARLPELADELVRMKVDIIVVSSTPAVLAAKNATRDIPIVFHTIGDPVASGVVASLARPGGNITGLTMGGAELYGKRLELLKETIPKLSRAAVLWNPTSPGIRQNLEATQTAAQSLRLQIQSLEIQNPEDIEPAFETAARAKIGALLITQSPPITTVPKRIVEVAAKQRLPVIYPQAQWPDMGGLMSYGANVEESYRYLASYVDKIFKGSKPAELPVERSRKLELIINLKAAKQIGLTIPPNVLARADKVKR
jgi:putative ABC transport system substrate-binding protein